MKISLDNEHKKRGYGFVTFEDKKYADHALNTQLDGINLPEGDKKIAVYNYAPKDKKHMRKAVNQIYVKNFPEDWTEIEVKQHFSQYGEIMSSFFKVTEEVKLPTCFICYGRGDGDIQYGFECVERAIEGEKDKEHQFGGKPYKFYVKEAIPKTEREM